MIFGVSQARVQKLNLTLGEGAVPVLGLANLAEQLDSSTSALVLVIAPDVPLHQAIEIVQRYRLRQNQIGFVLVRERVDIRLLTTAMRVGIREVVDAEDPAEILASVTRVREWLGAEGADSIASGSPSRGKLLLVFSAKGGCGKTTLATNIAQSLAQSLVQSMTAGLAQNSAPNSTQSSGPNSVCLVDLDLQFGDVAVALQTEPTKTISDALRMQETLDDEGVRSLLVQRGSLSLLLAPVSPADLERISAALVTRILHSLRRQFDYVVIDAAPAFNDVILGAFEAADRHLLLTTQDAPSLKNLRVALDTLDALGMPANRRRIVVNRATDASLISVGQIEKTLGAKVFASVPESPQVVTSINTGETLVELFPRDPAAQAFGQIATDLLRDLNPEVATTDSTRRSGSDGLLKHLWRGRR
jgi:pilus assembly protein CpaE